MTTTVRSDAATRGISWRALRDDARQLVAVLAVLAIALLAGLALKGISENQTRVLTAGGVTASVPVDWVFQPGAGDLVFVVNDPRLPGHRYLVRRIDTGGRGLTEAIDMYTGAKSQLLSAYQPISRQEVTIGGRSGQAVTYAFVVEREGQVPQAIQARDVYFEAGDRVLVISTEAPAGRFDASVTAFDAFVRSVGV